MQVRKSHASRKVISMSLLKVRDTLMCCVGQRRADFVRWETSEETKAELCVMCRNCVSAVTTKGLTPAQESAMHVLKVQSLLLILADKE